MPVGAMKCHLMPPVRQSAIALPICECSLHGRTTTRRPSEKVPASWLFLLLLNVVYERRSRETRPSKQYPQVTVCWAVSAESGRSWKAADGSNYGATFSEKRRQDFVEAQISGTTGECKDFHKPENRS